MKVTVLGVERIEEPLGFAARVEVGDFTYGVSQLAGENGWTVDSTVVTASGYPVHVNGYGARYLSTSLLVEPAAVQALNAAAFDMATGEGRR